MKGRKVAHQRTNKPVTSGFWRNHSLHLPEKWLPPNGAYEREQREPKQDLNITFYAYHLSFKKDCNLDILRKEIMNVRDRNVAVTFTDEVIYFFFSNWLIGNHFKWSPSHVYIVSFRVKQVDIFQYDCISCESKVAVQRVSCGWIKRQRRAIKREMAIQSAGTQTQLGYGEAVAA